MAVTTVLAGCESGDDDDGDGSADAAATVTLDEAATTAGGDTAAGGWCPVTTEQVSGIVRHDVVEDQPCTWHAPDLTAAVLEVYVSGTDAGHLAGSTDAVDGVGDAAAFDVSDALVLERHGAHWVVQIINIGGGSDVVAKDAEIELAKLVVDGVG
jgi:hypothetical protein